ncbi:DUF4234 domain-containing protein [Schwartzia succinivorans]|jgi:hypothetical protein|uniref:DUF4234 domain-containing protein n=1 Tax=Schwartzia succinivorans DSM 10502 TaxID=1123243 RepID=A0A1M4Z137_9FIRM|nr:DUF4234 domain-containing protein [Schwartzia succinivorans]MBQ1470065.1 DUF4234 domain-containing protein [Schwartzia sp. (in: firmicutes)]MBQ1918314.1 DUF4234 domain-containing protein [Schwartzia sp. (in: firmicutes)]MBQ3862870.1 DUF4234 domain-containing protein [Schwartzia sp. (in: firmicutes)]SHF11779.1 protein of unknown function [Schwartzia succinivorans DSM 10502]
MQKIERHDITLRILFTFLTCGLYGLYWMAQVTNDVHAVSGKPQCAGGGKAVLFSVLTCSIYMYYWIYKIGGELVEARYRMGLALDVVEKKIYRNVIVIMTLVSIGISGLQIILQSFDDEYAKMNPDLLLMLLFWAFIINVVIQGGLAALLLWFVYKRSNPSPRILYVLMFLLRTNIFTLGFLQDSLNDISDRQANGEIELQR